ncbi:unnamed protein product [Prorocentrum cordatum]|uniref:EF-hand domain-containing protein n=1 Tax=Prorocentrum cordatum TaxID=2364126 RepID=A0ABN9YC75_9DINO|nr:unnamed protein product [Polarella glacialis]
MSCTFVVASAALLEEFGAGTVSASTQGLGHDWVSKQGSMSVVECEDQIVSQILAPPAFSTDVYMSEMSGQSISVRDSVVDGINDSWDREERVLHQLRRQVGTKLSSKSRSDILESRRLAKPPRVFFWLRWLMSKPQYELGWAVLIVSNLVCMILEEEYRGMRRGYELGDIYVNYGSPEYSNTWWPGADTAFYLMECLFAGFFTLEQVITISYDVACALADWPTHRTPFWRDPLDFLDMLIVICSDVSLCLGMVDATINIQLFRILRLARLLRLLRLLRKINQFDPLHLMATAIKGSMGALMFSSILLITVLTLFAMVLTNALRAAYLGDNSPLQLEKQRELFRYFGTYSRSMLSMFELALANWPTVTRFMVEELNEFFGPVCILWKLSVGFAVVGVINGVFIRETFSVAENDEFIMYRSRMRQVLQHRDRMTRLFQLADRNSDGVVDRREFRRVFEKPAIKAWLEAMELRCDDADTLFVLIAGSENGVITQDELINGIAQLKGPARNIDLQQLLHSRDASEAMRPRRSLASRKYVSPKRSFR